ncbi:ammonia-dependent NAD(+) synthetase [Paenibacillus urinalis]|uniref:NH(3)-dependent NAD(+) synthetase n=2 Tax=Paenibacillus TaxID=44249 RepID=A0ABY7XBP9_9BACL|nr:MULTISPECIES: ammonia-dependent NAD(+) synthetase [Paenibacillus]OMC72185.1 NAD(+) synthase [Paenibacillus sp. FSL H7-0326]WDH99583.1 ammonia-dependent NAD(+) synthetase [Paenibacillus urinalis]WDI03217.1 ammonia-dependent NAD(+) synthetase [Paenibacillus urinalis]
MNTQKQIIEELNVKPSIVASEEISARVNFLKDYCKKTGAKGYVLGISGGQDSTLAGRLAQLAVESLREEGYEARFTAIRLPYGTQLDEADAMAALEFIQPDDTVVFNIEDSVNAFTSEYNSAAGQALADYHKGNVKARMRMIVQYAVAGERGALVIGTDHAAEAITGFFTKFGDGGADLIPLSGLSKSQGRELLKELGASERLYLKTPTADLLDNKPQQADETELGITYETLDSYLTGHEVDSTSAAKIEARYKASQHKRELPVTPQDEWWK